MLVADIYNTQISPITENHTVSEALELLEEKHYNSLLVTSEKGELRGVLSLQDIAAAIVPYEMRDNASLAHALYKPNFFQELCLELKDKKVKDVMRKEFIIASPETSVLEIAADFLHNDLYIVPVMQNHELIGIVTRSEIKQAIVKALNLS